MSAAGAAETGAATASAGAAGTASTAAAAAAGTATTATAATMGATTAFRSRTPMPSLFHFKWTLGEPATDFVRRGPHHLGVMTHFKKVVFRGAVRKVVLLQEPCLDGKHPGNLMCRNENVLATGAEVIDPTTSDVVVNQELALVGPFLSVFGCT